MVLWPIRLALRIIVPLLAAALVYVGVTFVQVLITSKQDNPQRSDAALVLGAPTGQTALGPDLRGRLDRAAGLYRAHNVHFIVVTGGPETGSIATVAQVATSWLEHQGIPAAAILTGFGGGDTWQDVDSVVTAMHALHVHRVLVVTDPFNEDRAMAIVSGFGFTVSPAPSHHAPIGGFGLVGDLFRESVDVAAGRIVGYHTLSTFLH